MDMEKRGFFSVCDECIEHGIKCRSSWPCSFFPNIQGTPEALLPEQAVLGACVLHQIGVWISATGSRDCVKAGTYRVWCGNGLETLRSGAEFFRNTLKLKRIDGNKGK